MARSRPRFGAQSRSRCEGCGAEALSSLFDVPASLVVILTLAAAGGDATRLEHTIPHLDETQSLAEGPCRFTEQRWLQALDDGVGGADYRALEARSEERRVGKEGRSRWS